MKILPPPLRRALVAVARDLLAPQAVRRRAEWPVDRSGVSIHMVVGHDMLPMALLALRSWEFHTRRSWEFFVHEDGSFTGEDRAALHLHFPRVRIIDRTRADMEVREGLAEFGCCREHRMNHNWFLKVFDTRHYAPGDRYIIIDSDLVFFGEPLEITDWIDHGATRMFVMEDDREKYSHPRSELESRLGIKLCHRANSGIDLMTKSAADLSLAERFLCQCAGDARQYEFLEQTIFAIWASAGGGGILAKDRYEISWNNFRNPKAVCRHYIGAAKRDNLYLEGATSFWWQSRTTVAKGDARKTR